MPVWNMRIFPVASIPFPKGIAIQSIKETTIDNCKKYLSILVDVLTITQEVDED